MCGNVTSLTAEQKEVAFKVLVGLRHTFTMKSSLTFSQGSLMLKSVQFTYRNALVVNYNKLFAKLDPQASEEFFTTLADEPVQEQPAVFNLVCPDCKVIKNVAHIKLRNEATWKSIKCSTCERFRTARQWLCTCTHPWHSCPTHAIVGHACGSVNSALRAHKVSSKTNLIRANSNAGPSQPLPTLGRPSGGKGPDKKKRARLTPETGIPSSFLPAILAQRFKEPTSLSSCSSPSLSLEGVGSGRTWRSSLF